jgi:hypothetical protein
MKNYKIEVKLKITATRDSYNSDTIGECELSKTALLPASKVKDEATKLVRNAVAQFSESSTLGLSPIIEEEPKLGDEEAPTTLTV